MNKQAQSHRGELADIAGMKNFIRWRWNYDDDTKDLRFNQPGDIEFAGYYDKKQEDPKEKIVVDIRVSAVRQWKLNVCLFSLHVPTREIERNTDPVLPNSTNKEDLSSPTIPKCRIPFQWKSWWRWRIDDAMKEFICQLFGQSFLGRCSKNNYDQRLVLQLKWCGEGGREHKNTYIYTQFLFLHEWKSICRNKSKINLKIFTL